MEWTFKILEESYAPADPEAKKKHVAKVHKLVKMAKALGYTDQNIADFDNRSAMFLTFTDGICISIDDMSDYGEEN